MCERCACLKLERIMQIEKGLLSRIQKMNVDLAIFHEEKDLPNISENETLYFGEKIWLQGVLLEKLENEFAVREEEIEKQIEAVRGLIKLYDHVTTKGNPKESRLVGWA